MPETVTFAIVGKPASGKSFVGARLAQHGCERLAVSTLIKQYAQEHGLPITSRADSVAIHDRMLAEDPLMLTRPFIRHDRDSVNEGLRVPNEAEKLRNLGRLIVIATHCDSDSERFRRAMAAYCERGHRDKTNLTDFLADEAFEYYNPDPQAPSVRHMVEMADYHINTLNLSRAQVHEYVDNIYALTA